MTVGLAVTGATGRMGREVLAETAERDDCEVVCAVARSGGEEREGVPIERAEALPGLLEEREPAALVDFSAPAASVEYARACAEAGVACVVGTTGFDDAELAALREASATVPLLRAPNFARGVATLASFVGEAVASLPGYDVEVTETHHNGKRDAPSGTALRLVREIEGAREESERVHGREGEAPRAPEEIGVHARRAGDVTGEHEVLLAGNHEVLSLTHRAGDRRVFAAGALDAADWLAGRNPGWYNFGAVIDDT